MKMVRLSCGNFVQGMEPDALSLRISKEAVKEVLSVSAKKISL